MACGFFDARVKNPRYSSGTRLEPDDRVTVDLSTTNTLLGIMAAVSVLEAIAVAALLVGGVLAYRKLGAALKGIEERQVAPAMSRVNAVLDDVKAVTGVAKDAAADLNAGVRWGWGTLLDWILKRNRAA